MPGVDNSRMLRAASFRLATAIDNYSRTSAEPEIERIKFIASKIEGLAKDYGNRRVSRVKKG